MLEGEIAERVGDALQDAGLVLGVTLTRSEPSGTGDSWNPEPPSETTFMCVGFLESFSAADRANTTILATDVRVVVAASSLETEPVVGDMVTIRDVTYTVVGVGTDPALALWDLQARV